MKRSNIALRMILGTAATLMAVTGCHRAERSEAEGSRSPQLSAEEGRSPSARRTHPRLRPRPRTGAASTAAPARIAPARIAPARIARPTPDPTGQPKPIIPTGPTPFTLVQAGATPRITLRYRFNTDDKLVWRTTMDQVTRVRTEKQCPPDLKTKLRGPMVRTIPVRYGVDLSTTITRAPDGLYKLDTRLAKVTLSLPPALSSQRQLLLKVLSGLRYSQRMSVRGQVTRFSFGKMTPRSLLNLGERLKAPLSHLQPMLPSAAVGIGAVWQHQRQHPLVQPGGRIMATYLTRYRLTAIRKKDNLQVADIEMTTRVKMRGKVMGIPFTGGGSGSAKLTLDAVRGVVLAARGNLLICSAVKDRSSTNHTSFTQTLQSSGAATPPPKRPTPKRPTPKPSAPAKTP
jgi:hypothetical protein